LRLVVGGGRVMASWSMAYHSGRISLVVVTPRRKVGEEIHCLRLVLPSGLLHFSHVHPGYYVLVWLRYLIIQE
jgi:hypothetical protein